MEGYIIYPDQITEIVLGKVDIKGYDCDKTCIKANGYIAQNETMTVYFDCMNKEKGDGCSFLEGFLKGEGRVGLKKKRGDENDIINDLVEAVEDSDLTEIKIPFKMDTSNDRLSPQHLEKFFSAFLGFKTELVDVQDITFTLVLHRPEGEKKTFTNLKESIKKFFSLKKG
jgi:hypothetical protein